MESESELGGECVYWRAGTSSPGEDDDERTRGGASGGESERKRGASRGGDGAGERVRARTDSRESALGSGARGVVERSRSGSSVGDGGGSGTLRSMSRGGSRLISIVNRFAPGRGLRRLGRAWEGGAERRTTSGDVKRSVGGS